MESANGYRVSLESEVNVLSLANGDVCTTLGICYKILNCILERVNLMVF